MQLRARARDVRAFLLLPPRAAQMTCVICFTAANAERVCSCAALACRGYLLALLDHGKERCVVCGSRFHPSAVVNACLSGLEGPASDESDPATAYVNLAVAYSTAGDPRCALRSLAIAQHLVVPGSRWDQVISLETAQNLLAIGQIEEAEGCLRSVMPRLLEMPTTVSSGVLFANLIYVQSCLLSVEFCSIL